MGDPPNRELAVFSAARLLPVGERGAYLDEACVGDAALRQRVEELLQAGEGAGAVLDKPAPGAHKGGEGGDVPRPGPTVRVTFTPSEKAGDRIGRYKLLQQIGEGGCGVVYMAEQQEPVRRLVALKVIKLGMDTREVIARFEAERQALALMDHPNIAKVLDAGATETGRPYFVMELVRGIKITDFCDKGNLSTRERLDLFVQVCQAIQHAHQKGIIHRDIKPSNILVTMNDGLPLPKVIDFGIAKATHGKLTDKTLFTAFEQFIGTPAYMSPEQAEMSALDIDTRSDIYSLGVLLYELLTGQTPFNAREILKAGLDEIRRVIREQEPARPSTRLSTMLAGELAVAANHRQVEPPRLVHLVRGDLDWIVMKALEKNRTRRYETANGLAADIQRHLNNEPVMASPPGNLYRLQKLVRRNKLAFIAVSAVAAALVLGVVASTTEAFRAKRAEQQQSRLREMAEQSQRAESQQRREAEVARDEEARQRRIASEQALLARRRFYAAELNLASQAWEAGQIPRTMDLLETQRPHPGQDDLRGFEWFHLWRLCNGRLLRTIRAHSGEVYGVAFSPDGTMLASCSVDGAIYLWDTATGQQRFALKPEPWAVVTAVAFTPDGKTLASGGWDGLVRLWDVDAGKLRATFLKQPDAIQSVAVSTDGGTLATGGDAGEVRLWNLSTGLERASFTGHQGPVASVVFSPDNTTLASGSGWGGDGGALDLWTLTNGTALSKAKAASATGSIAFSPDGKTLVTANNGEIGLWDVATCKLRYTLKGHKGGVYSVAFLPDGRGLVSCGEDRTVRLWPLPANGQGNVESRVIGVHLGNVMRLAVSGEGTILASGATDGSVKLWSLSDGNNPAGSPVHSEFKFGDDINAWDDLQSVLPSPDGRTLFVVTARGAATWDLASGRRQNSWPEMVGCGVLSSDGKLLATIPKRNDGMVKLWDAADGHLLGTVQAHSNAPTSFFGSLAFSPDGRNLASASRFTDVAPGGRSSGAFATDSLIKFWDPHGRLKAGGDIKIPSVPGICALAYSPDGRMLAAAIRDTLVLILDTATGRTMRRLIVEHGPVSVFRIVFSPDDRLLATAGESGIVKLWDVRTGRLHAALHGHTAAIPAVAFSPDGGTVATGGNDTTVRLWDTATGQERMTFKGHDSLVSSVAFSPDGETLIAGYADGFVDLWRGGRVPQAEVEAVPVEEAFAPGAETDNALARDLATNPDARTRDGLTAVELAEDVVASTDRKNPQFLDTLAAAYAEVGKFTNAVRVEQEAMAQLQDEPTKKDFGVRLDLYRSNTPFRDAARSQSP